MGSLPYCTARCSWGGKGGDWNLGFETCTEMTPVSHRLRQGFGYATDKPVAHERPARSCSVPRLAEAPDLQQEHVSGRVTWWTPGRHPHLRTGKDRSPRQIVTRSPGFDRGSRPRGPLAIRRISTAPPSATRACMRAWASAVEPGCPGGVVSTLPGPQSEWLRCDAATGGCSMLERGAALLRVGIHSVNWQWCRRHDVSGIRSARLGAPVPLR